MKLQILLWKGGKTEDDIAKKYPSIWIRNSKGLKSLSDIVNKKDRIGSTWDDIDCRWYYGPTGTGKTESVYKEFGHENIYRKRQGTKWWDNYYNQKVILIDEYRRNNEFPISDLLEVASPHPYTGETKGGHVNISSKIIIITSNHPPDSFWKLKEDLDAVKRRFKIIEFKKNE